MVPRCPVALSTTIAHGARKLKKENFFVASLVVHTSPYMASSSSLLTLCPFPLITILYHRYSVCQAVFLAAAENSFDTANAASMEVKLVTLRARPYERTTDKLLATFITGRFFFFFHFGVLSSVLPLL
jgi:hypothetical protein